MNIFEPDKIILFIIFFVPGFISMKIYHLLIASDKINFSNSLSEAIGFSSINFASFSWLIYLMYRYNFIENYLTLYILINLFIIFIAPILWTIIYVKFAKSNRFKKYILNPIRSPWDYFFEQRKSYWIIVNLKNGEKIGGAYSENSFSSVYPHKEQLYLEELWELNDDGSFKKKKNRTKGVIILGDEIKSIEFYE